MWHKKWAGEKYYCLCTMRDSARFRLFSIRDRTLNFRTCFKVSGYRSGCQRHSRIHLCDSTFKSHLDAAAAAPEVPVAVWTRWEELAWDHWSCSGGWMWPTLLWAPTGNVRMTLGRRVCVYRKQQIKNKARYTQGSLPVLLRGRAFPDSKSNYRFSPGRVCKT